MKILVIQSSPNRTGLTRSLAQAAMDGARQAGATVDLVDLNRLDIRHCRACGNGWGHHFKEDSVIAADECIIKDDFAALRARVIDAEGLVFCSPVYFWDLSESARAFLDRLRRSHYAIRDASPFAGKPVVSIVAAGGSGNGAIQAATNLENYFTRWMGMKRVATLPVTRQTCEIYPDVAFQAGALLVRTIAETATVVE